jgi:ribosomal 30S subunit maturation factor RimM
MGYERLERGKEGSSRTTKGKLAIKGKTNNRIRLIKNEGYPNKKYKRNNREHKANRWERKKQNKTLSLRQSPRRRTMQKLLMA